jgi:CheY-like chemotaxis protein
MDDYVSKPIDPEALASALAQVPATPGATDTGTHTEGAP